MLTAFSFLKIKVNLDAGNTGQRRPSPSPFFKKNKKNKKILLLTIPQSAYGRTGLHDRTRVWASCRSHRVSSSLYSSIHKDPTPLLCFLQLSICLRPRRIFHLQRHASSKPKNPCIRSESQWPKESCRMHLWHERPLLTSRAPGTCPFFRGLDRAVKCGAVEFLPCVWQGGCQGILHNVCCGRRWKTLLTQ